MAPTAERGHVTENMSSHEKCAQGPVFRQEAGKGRTGGICRGRGLNGDAIVLNTLCLLNKCET